MGYELRECATLPFDFYELTMASSYLHRGMTKPATFSLFVRRLPPGRGFLVSAGVESSLEFLERLHIEGDDFAFVKQVLGSDRHVEGLRGLRFSGDVWAVPEGRIVFAGEPLLEVTASLPEAQLVETFLLNQVTFQTTVASKAARCYVAAQGRQLVDFSFRRTQGIETGVEVARLCAIVGFSSTSNVEAARRFGIPASGTMGHSYVQAFRTEKEAFNAFAEDFPEHITFVVDTYDTLDGVKAAVEVAKGQNLTHGFAVRLDSGDLDTLARQTRSILDAAGLNHVRVFASGGLDEFGIKHLVDRNAPIDGFGVGTRVGVAADAPYLDSVYKLVQYGERYTLKLSPDKETYPGPKQILRHGNPVQDVLALRAEVVPVGHVPLLEPVMVGGKRVHHASSIADSKRHFLADLDILPDRALDLKRPEAVVPVPSKRLQQLWAETVAEIRGRTDLA